MNSLYDSGAIFSYHRDMIAMHGEEDSKALGWLDKHSQTVRFEALSKIGNLNGHTSLTPGVAMVTCSLTFNRNMPS